MTTRLGLGVPVLPVTATWAFPLALYNVFLTARVTQQRIKTQKLMGDTTDSASESGSDPLFVAIRAHSNFIENTPFILLLAALVELNGANRKHLNFILGAFFVFRVAHVELGLNAPANKGLGRLVGHYGTQALYLILGARAAYSVKSVWGF